MLRPYVRFVVRPSGRRREAKACTTSASASLTIISSLPSLSAHLMSARSTLLPGATLPAFVLCLAAAVGCQSMFRSDVTAARGQSPAGLGGGIPKPPPPPKQRQPGDPEDEETFFDQVSNTVGGYFKPAPNADQAKAKF